MKIFSFLSKNLNPLLLLAFVVVSFYSFSNSPSFQKSEYLFITIEYKKEAQYIHVNGKKGELKRIAVVDKDNSYQKKRMKSKGYKVSPQELKSIYDQKKLIKMLEQYEEDGWTLNSHSMAISDEGNKDYFSEGSKVAQYVLTRKL